MSDEHSEIESTHYWLRARRPLASLVFLIPLLVIYECGVLWLGKQDPEAMRNGADYWMRGALSAVGLKHSLLLPIMLMFALFSWHILARHPWRVKPLTVVGMLAESIMFACCLIAVGRMHGAFFSSLPELKEMAVTPVPASARVISFIGAGVYEEVLFRLCLVPVTYGGLRLFEIPHRFSAISSVVLTSVIFAVAHYVGPAADSFTLFTFSFRAIAGVFFAALFFVRGFGITVGAHAAYDLLVGVLLATE